jgi:hypothetical protein
VPKLESVKVSLSLPTIGSIEGVWEPDEREQQAAWELYVELITRISVAELQPYEGALREALTSLHIFFDVTRKVLRASGPSIAKPKGKDKLSLAFVAVAILNTVLRPVLAKWHPLLNDYEHTRELSVSTFDHEQRWEHAKELRSVLNGVRIILIEYANLLAEVAGIPRMAIQMIQRTTE